MEDKIAMAGDNPANTTPASRSRLRRCLWDGVLPEALGLCFVGIIFGGFSAAYLVADAAWQRRALEAQQGEAQRLAQGLATILGAFGDEQAAVPDEWASRLGQLPSLRSLRWTTSDSETRLAWPSAVAAVSGLTGADDRGPPVVAQVPVQTATGAPAGQLRLELAPPIADASRHALLWNWGIAAGVTLVVFMVVYRRLRRHLRPMAAIERSLHCYAQGLEQELVAMTLNDSLGAAARGWNRLIAQLTDLQQQVQSGQTAPAPGSVLERFEGALFRRVADRLPLGVLCVAENQRINYANAAGAALLGRGVEELVGRPAAEALPDDNVRQVLANVRAGIGAGHAVDHTRQDGEQEIALRFRVLPLTRSGGGGGETLVTIEDIAPLREGQKARDNFLYHVTHELRTPLTNIHAYVETLTKPDFDDEQTRKECYNVIVSETRRLSSLVENILSISQLEVGTARLDIGEVDLQRLLRQMVQDNLGAADGKRIDLTLALPPKVPKIRGDKQRLSVLINNLIGNAIKYTPEGGQVQVKLELTPHTLRIAVSDTGIGIAPPDQPHVFEKFYRAASDAVQSVTGTGLGLAIAREVARLHGGDIQLQSTLGKGSVFTIELPLSAVDAAEVPRS
ncbi:MAG: ATP-binding protein [Planctomycetota bacterium]